MWRFVRFVEVGLFAVLSLLCSACTRHLSRSTAHEQLELLAKGNPFLLPQAPRDLFAEIGHIAICEGSPDGSPDVDLIESNPSPWLLEKMGLITIHRVKTHVWDVKLTSLGEQSIEGGNKYAHEQRGECDQWQVNVPTAKYDHVDITEILEEGVRARVDAFFTYKFTSAGEAARKLASGIVIEVGKKAYGEEIAKRYASDEVGKLLGDRVPYMDQNEHQYAFPASFQFDKFDDGWKLSPSKVAP